MPDAGKTFQNDDVPGGFVLNGWYILAMLVAFFGIIFAVNFTMTYDAYATFSGEVASNAYEVGLVYNKELQAARDQDQRHWQVTLHPQRNSDGKLSLELNAKDASGAALEALKFHLIFSSPVNEHLDKIVELTPQTPGVYVGVGEIPLGRWNLVIEGSANGEVQFTSHNRLVLK